MNNILKELNVFNNGKLSGALTFDGAVYAFQYCQQYVGPPISLTMPVRPDPYVYVDIPPFFDGLLPEGYQLEGLLRINKIDKHDYMRQLEAVGNDLVGTVTLKCAENTSDVS